MCRNLALDILVFYYWESIVQFPPKKKEAFYKEMKDFATDFRIQIGIFGLLIYNISDIGN